MTVIHTDRRAPGLNQVTVLVVTLLCAAVVWAKEAPVGPIAVAPAVQADTPPTIDGALDDSCWREAAGLAGFTRVGTDRPASQPTVVRLLFDREALYVGFLCHEPNPDELAYTHSGPDADVWFDDSVELFIDPGHTHERYFQFALNCIGATFDRHMENIQWTDEWRVGTRIGDDRWTAEVAIPFETLGCDPPREGDVFAANFCRNRKTSNADPDSHGEWSSWARVQSQYHEPQNFGHVIFTDSPEAITLQMLTELAANPLCTGGEPMTRTVELALQSGTVRYTPHRARAMSELAGDRSEVAEALSEVEHLLRGDRWEDEALRDQLSRRREALDEALEQLRAGIGEETDAVGLQRIQVELDRLRGRAQDLLWKARFELLFMGLEATDTTN